MISNKIRVNLRGIPKKKVKKLTREEFISQRKI